MNTTFSLFDRTQIFLALSRGDLPVKYHYMTQSGADAWVALENNDDTYGEYIPHSAQSSQLLMKYKDTYLNALARDDVIILDFGPGEGRPVYDFLKEVSLQRKVHYYGFDISKGVLEVNKRFITNISKNIKYTSIQIDFESGRFLEEVAKVRTLHGGKPVLALCLGNTVGNFTSAERIISNITEMLGVQDKLIIDMQRSNVNNPQWVSELVTAYNDNIVKKFAFSTLVAIDFDISVLNWSASFNINTQTIDMIAVCNKKYTFTMDDQSLVFKKGQRIRLGKSAKFNERQLATLAENLHLQMNLIATSDDGTYLQMCVSPKFSF